MRFKYLFGIIPNESLDVSSKNTHGEHIRIFNKKIFLKLIKNAWFKKIINNSWSGINNYIFKTTWMTTNLLARHFYYICIKK